MVTGAVASLLARVEQTMRPGQEISHLRSLLQSASYRRTDVRFMVDVDESMHEVPYLALRWQWKLGKQFLPFLGNRMATSMSLS